MELSESGLVKGDQLISKYRGVKSNLLNLPNELGIFMADFIIDSDVSGQIMYQVIRFFGNNCSVGLATGDNDNARGLSCANVGSCPNSTAGWCVSFEAINNILKLPSVLLIQGEYWVNIGHEPDLDILGWNAQNAIWAFKQSGAISQYDGTQFECLSVSQYAYNTQ